MAEINNSQVVLFDNEQVRGMADSLYKAYWQAKQFLLNYNSDSIGSLINDAGSSNLVADGSEADGRTRITGGDIYNLVTAATAFIAFVEGESVATADRTTVITKPHVND